jgi:hypothetical protein
MVWVTNHRRCGWMMTMMQQEHDKRSRRRSHRGVAGDCCLQTPSSQGLRMLSDTGAHHVIGSGILWYTPWGSIIKIVGNRMNRRGKLNVSMSASTGSGEDEPSSSSSSPSPRSSGTGVGSRSRQWTNIILGINLL